MVRRGSPSLVKGAGRGIISSVKDTRDILSIIRGKMRGRGWLTIASLTFENPEGRRVMRL